MNFICLLERVPRLLSLYLSNEVISQADGVAKRLKKQMDSDLTFSLELKWLWFDVGNRYFHCNGLKEICVLDEVGGLTVEDGAED